MKTEKNKKRRRESHKRRVIAHKIVPAQDQEYELIDWNYSRFVVGYCKTKHAWLTLGLYNVHGCEGCMHYQEGVSDEEEIVQPS